MLVVISSLRFTAFESSIAVLWKRRPLQFFVITRIEALLAAAARFDFLAGMRINNQ
jgi:hypothetical protein